MNFIEFDSIQSQSESILKLTKKIAQLQAGFPVYIYGQKGTGRNSFAQFLMKSTDTKKLIPQTEENIEKAEWLDVPTIKNTVIKNTYPSVLDLIFVSIPN